MVNDFFIFHLSFSFNPKNDFFKFIYLYISLLLAPLDLPPLLWLEPCAFSYKIIVPTAGKAWGPNAKHLLL